MLNVNRGIMLAHYSLLLVLILAHFASAAPHDDFPVPPGTDGAGPVSLVNEIVADGARERQDDTRQERVRRSPRMIPVTDEAGAAVISGTGIAPSRSISFEKRSPQFDRDGGRGGGGGGGRGGGGGGRGGSRRKPATTAGGQQRPGRTASANLKNQVATVTQTLQSIPGQTGKQVVDKVDKILAVEKLEDGARATIQKANSRNPQVTLAIKTVSTDGPKLIAGLKELRRVAASGGDVQAVNSQLQEVNRLREPLLRANAALIQIGQSS